MITDQGCVIDSYTCSFQASFKSISPEFNLQLTAKEENPTGVEEVASFITYLVVLQDNRCHLMHRILARK